MRDFKGMKRQRGRNRSGGSQGNQGKPQQNANRAFESNGQDNVKIRGNAQHVFERYQQLARDASSSGDRVLAENYLQHAEHYFRVIRAVQPNRPTADIIGRETFSSGFDIDFEDESGINADPEHPGAPVLLTNRSVALRIRGVDNFNAGVRDKDPAKTEAAKRDFLPIMIMPSTGSRSARDPPCAYD